jgi:hypothetical protein
LEKLISEIDKYNDNLDINNPNSLSSKLTGLTTSLNSKQDELDRPAREEQKFLNELKEWEQKAREIEGSVEQEGSIRYLENQLNYVQSVLPGEIQAKLQERRKLLVQLFEKKLKLRDIRREMFTPLTSYRVRFVVAKRDSSNLMKSSNERRLKIQTGLLVLRRSSWIA